MFFRPRRPDDTPGRLAAILSAFRPSAHPAAAGWRRTMIAFLAAGGYSLAVTQLSVENLQLLHNVITAVQAGRCAIGPAPPAEAAPAE